MKRRRFMESVSRMSLMRKEITGDDVANHKALSGLCPDFRASTDWCGPEVPSDGEGMVVQMLRLPNDEPNPTEGVRLVFVDGTSHKGGWCDGLG